MKIMVFLHGTSIMHKSALGKSREDIVKQVGLGDPSVHDYISYVPVKNAVNKLNNWVKQGAEVMYLSSHENEQDVGKDKLVLKKYNFPEGVVYYRKPGKEYKDIVEEVVPDILVEDDCESIGGKNEMVYTHIKPEIKRNIKLIKIKEFSGIDYLPDSVGDLLTY